MDEMSRGEMIRRLDEVSRLVHDGLASGPLTAAERDVLAASLARLLPAVADSLQAQEDREAAQALMGEVGPGPSRGSSTPIG
jgi:hypothetical protein